MRQLRQTPSKIIPRQQKTTCTSSITRPSLRALLSSRPHQGEGAPGARSPRQGGGHQTPGSILYYPTLTSKEGNQIRSTLSQLQAWKESLCVGQEGRQKEGGMVIAKKSKCRPRTLEKHMHCCGPS